MDLSKKYVILWLVLEASLSGFFLLEGAGPLPSRELVKRGVTKGTPVDTAVCFSGQTEA